MGAEGFRPAMQSTPFAHCLILVKIRQGAAATIVGGESI